MINTITSRVVLATVLFSILCQQSHAAKRCSDLLKDQALKGTSAERGPLLAEKLIRHIEKQQQSDGSFKTSLYTRKASTKWPLLNVLMEKWPVMPETNPFTTLQILLGLEEINAVHKVSLLPKINRRAEKLFERFMDDAAETNERPGAIAYWPLVEVTEVGPLGIAGLWLIDPPKRRLVRFYTDNPLIYNSVKNLTDFAPNIPPDLDTSSRLALWAVKNDKFPEFVRAFVSNVGYVADIGRTRQEPRERRWKKINSGAFLTWVEKTDRPDRDPRLPNEGVNDVDGVVVLNTLAALAYIRGHANIPFPNPTLLTMKDSVALIRKTINSDLTDQTSIWYGRESNFFLALARAREAGLHEVDDVLDLAKNRTRQLAGEYKEGMEAKKRRVGLNPSDALEAAELAIILKKFYSPGQRSKNVISEISFLEKMVSDLLTVSDREAELASGSIYPVETSSGVVDWVSSAYASTLALEALMIP